MSLDQSFKRNVPLLALCHALFMSGTSLLVATTALVGYSLAIDKRFASAAFTVQMLATMLARSGYRTEAHTDGGNVSARLGFDQGFERYLERRGARTVFEGARKALERFAQKNGPGTRDPFFLFVHTFEVHDPYLSPAQYAAEFVDPSYSGDIVGSRDELDRLEGAGRHRR